MWWSYEYGALYGSKTQFTVRPWVLNVKADRRKSQSSSVVDTSIYPKMQIKVNITSKYTLL